MIEKLKSKKLCLSAEVFPPKKDGELESIIRTLRDIQKLKPDFISITYGANGSGSNKTADVASIAIDAFDMEVLTHLTAVNMTIEKLESLIETYKRKNVKKLLILRGDLADDSQFFDFHYANELALYIKKNHPEFTLFGACYPEGHPSSPNLDFDIDVISKKSDCGIEAFITQLFLDNNTYYNFMNKLEQRNLDLPITAGIMPIISKNQISRIVSMCGVEAPPKFVKMVANNSDNLYEAGIDYANEQIQDLINNGISNIHLYSMNKAEVARKVFEKFEKLR
jgi:methylenetetrahydrofolate reductase (NADPH)